MAHGQHEMGTSTSTGPRHEFSAAENETFAALARDMRFVGGFCMLTVVSGSLGVLGSVMQRQLGTAVWGVGLTVLSYFLAMWLKRSSESFARVVTTQHNDVAHLMAALDQLATMFRVLRVMLAVYLALFALGLVVALAAMIVRAAS